MMNEDEIRGLNCDFNYHNYNIFYEKLEEEANAAAGKPKENEEEREAGAEPAQQPEPVNTEPLVGFKAIVSEDNLMQKMWSKVQIDDDFKARYEDWLEEEVWTYFD